MGNAMNIELPNNFVLKLDELVSGDVEIRIDKRHGRDLDDLTQSFSFVTMAKAIVPRNRLQLIIEFLERVK